MVVIEVTLVLVRMVMMAMVVTLAVMMMMASSHTDRACVILFLQSNVAAYLIFVTDARTASV